MVGGGGVYACYIFGFPFFFFHLWAFRDGKTRRTGEKMKQKKRFHLGCVISFFFSGTVNLTISLIHCWIE